MPSTACVWMVQITGGGVGIEVFMTRRALDACGDCGNNRGGCGPSPPPSPDSGLQNLSPLTYADSPSCGIPIVPGTLWNAMIAPLLPLRLGMFYWYQGGAFTLFIAFACNVVRLIPSARTRQLRLPSGPHAACRIKRRSTNFVRSLSALHDRTVARCVLSAVERSAGLGGGGGGGA